ncbi:helix-turn-helix transcriptional regulator [Oceanirhabdus seepicola]|uniref:Helix-turn-helix transcriptional regulator n=1 Tax=Oceanirhabdus seepicola TaxID=2828781 RepID=A0A9J6P435_9CLOT|nr:helix-turn-helix transcriptional regulator [Oceanirhabdus seepicola]MCM1990328.1 helix-turn-helix transcriptional regulator [Oceanirhabdus seepicola]
MNIKICKNIAKLRKENKMTQAQVAEYLGVSPQAVSKWEQEAAIPDVYLIPKIAFFFNVSIDTLFGTSNIDTTDLLVSKYSTVRNEKNYKEAKEAVETLLDMNGEDMKALGLLCHLEYQRALEFLLKSKASCENLLKA